MQNDAAQIIDALGGTTAVAREIGAPITTVHSWRKNGIPSWRKPALDALAAKKHVDLNTPGRARRARARAAVPA